MDAPWWSNFFRSGFERRMAGDDPMDSEERPVSSLGGASEEPPVSSRGGSSGLWELKPAHAGYPGDREFMAAGHTVADARERKRLGSSGLWSLKPAHAGYPGGTASPGARGAAQHVLGTGAMSTAVFASLPDDVVFRCFRDAALSGRDAKDEFGCFSQSSVEQLAACADLASFSVEQLIALDLLGPSESTAARERAAEAASKITRSRRIETIVFKFNEEHRFPPYAAALPSFVLAAPRAAQLSLTSTRFLERRRTRRPVTCIQARMHA